MRESDQRIPRRRATRYLAEGSPFRFSPGGTLKEIRPDLFLSFMAKHQPHGCEEDILLEGLRAWSICPTKATGSLWQEAVSISSKDLVESAMAQRAVRLLDYSISFGDRGLEGFPFDVFVAIGGLKAAIAMCSQTDLARHQANQNESIKHVVGLIHVLHSHYSRPLQGNSKRWGINKGSEETALLYFGTKKKAEAIKDHWQELMPSAPLLYAATLVDADLFHWLLEGTAPVLVGCFNECGPAPVVRKWFSFADQIADQLRQHLAGASAPWPRLSSGHLEALPNVASDSDFKEMLKSNVLESDESTVPTADDGPNSPW